MSPALLFDFTPRCPKKAPLRLRVEEDHEEGEEVHKERKKPRAKDKKAAGEKAPEEAKKEEKVEKAKEEAEGSWLHGFPAEYLAGASMALLPDSSLSADRRRGKRATCQEQEEPDNVAKDTTKPKT